MKWLFLLAIRVYWLTPKQWRRRCIFKHSCSHYVYHVLREQGFLQGIRALRERMHQCTPRYAVYKDDNNTEWVILEDAHIVERKYTTI